MYNEFHLYTGIFTPYKTVSKLSLARHILNSNKDVTLLRYYTREEGQVNERKGSGK